MKYALPNSDLVLLGAGGHARVLADVLRLHKRRVAAVLDDDPQKQGSLFEGVEVINQASLLQRSSAEVSLINAVGSVKRPAERQKMFERFRHLGYQFAPVIHPSAILADDVRIDEGAQIMAGAVVQTGGRIGANTIVNTRALIEHDVTIAEHCHIAPGAIICGGVQIGIASHIGAGATIIQERRIGKNCLVGAGAVLVHDLAEDAQAWGVPAKIQQQSKP